MPALPRREQRQLTFLQQLRGPSPPTGPEAPSLTKTLETPVQVMRPGSVIAGKYKILEELGHGGMGIVYKAEDIKRRFIIDAHAALGKPSLVMGSGGR